MKSEFILEVKNLNVSFGKEKVIENLSFKVRNNEFISIIGPNGSGKSTLLKALVGLVPYEGKIKWKNGLKINYLPQSFSRENFNLVPISVEEFFELKNVKREEIKENLEKVGLNYEKVRNKNPAELSGGEFQRMLIAWTFVDNPDVVLLDEPTSGIDVGGEKTIYDLLYKYWKEEKKTIFLVTHEIEIVYKYSTNVLCLNKRCVTFGKPKEVLTKESLEKLYGMEISMHTHKKWI